MSYSCCNVRGAAQRPQDPPDKNESVNSQRLTRQRAVVAAIVSINPLSCSGGGKSPKVSWQAICGFAKAGEEELKQREPQPGQAGDAQLTLDPEPPGEAQTVPQAEGAPQAEGVRFEQPLRRSTRISKPVIGNRLVDALSVEIMQATATEEGKEAPDEQAPAAGEIFSFSTLFPLNDEDDVDPIHAYAASVDPDTLYHHEAMREPDAPQFRDAMVKEFKDQWDNGNFELKLRTDIPEGARILPAVWSMKRKRKILTGEVYRHKARMNLDGSKQIEGIDYNATYSPTASWPAV